MILIRMKEYGATPKGMGKVMRHIQQTAWRAAGKHWHENFRPKHFTHEGAQEYGYTPRKGEGMAPGSKGFRRSYTGKKLRKFGHALPLVWSGLSRNLTRLQDVRATSKGVRVVMNAPALNLRPRDGRIFMRDELTRVSIRERDQLIKVIDGVMQDGLHYLRHSDLSTF